MHGLCDKVFPGTGLALQLNGRDFASGDLSCQMKHFSHRFRFADDLVKAPLPGSFTANQANLFSEVSSFQTIANGDSKFVKADWFAYEVIRTTPLALQPTSSESIVRRLQQDSSLSMRVAEPPSTSTCPDEDHYRLRKNLIESQQCIEHTIIEV